jgi:hypothetical protein
MWLFSMLALGSGIVLVDMPPAALMAGDVKLTLRGAKGSIAAAGGRPMLLPPSTTYAGACPCWSTVSSSSGRSDRSMSIDSAIMEVSGPSCHWSCPADPSVGVRLFRGGTELSINTLTSESGSCKIDDVTEESASDAITATEEGVAVIARVASGNWLVSGS